MNKEPHSIPEVRRFIKEASIIYADIVMWMNYDGVDNEVANEAMIQINKRQARELIKECTSKGDTIICRYESEALWL